jgi:hypothetical protein
MKRNLFFLLLICLVSGEIKRPGGVTILADFGDTLAPGDSVVTTRYGEAELELADGGTVSIARDTVYQVQVIRSGGEPQTVMNVALGSVRFKFSTIAGRREPVVGAPTAVAGVRGTEFTAHVAADGSTVFVVEEGLVDVSAEGSSVRLEAGTGVEVLPGQTPGEPFDAIARAFDYSAYNDERVGKLVEDPVRAVLAHSRRLQEFAEQIAIIEPLYSESSAALEAANERVRELEGDERTEYFEQTLVPIRARTADLFDNMRFYGLSGLSLRRHVLGRIYLLVSLEYFAAEDDPVYRSFLDAHGNALEIYESGIVPVLDPTDL